MSCSKLAPSRAELYQQILKNASIEHGTAQCITTLPELCQLAIFDHLPVFDLLHTIGQVCTKWRSLHTVALRRRRVLTIMVRNSEYKGSFLHRIHRGWVSFFSDNISDYYPTRDFEVTQQTGLEQKLAWSSLDYCDLDQNDVKLMMDRFPKITTLDLMVNGLSQQMIDAMCFLLQTEWSSKLIAINLLISYNDQLENPSEINRLHSALESRKQLKELAYYVSQESSATRDAVAIQLPLFPHIERLRLEDPTYKAIKLVNATQMTSLSSIKLHNSYATYDQIMENMPEDALHFVERIAHLNLNFVNSRDYSRLANTFVNLTSLELSLDHPLRFERYSLKTIFANLSPLKQLTHLHIQGSLESYDMLVEPNPTRPVLSSVKCLSLYITHFDSGTIRRLNLQAVFPKVEVLHVKTLYWSRISHNTKLGSEEADNLRYIFKGIMFDMFLQPVLRSCASLRHIIVWANIQYAVAETESETVAFRWTKKDKQVQQGE